MSYRWVLISGSLVAHAGLVLALGIIEPPEVFVATAIEMVETQKEKPAPPPPVQVEPPPPRAEPRQKSANPKAVPEAAPPVESAPSNGALADLPDFGLELGGGSGPGLAVGRPAGVQPARPAAPVQKTLSADAAPARPAADPCSEGPAKPKLLNLPQPVYTDAARAAGVEGKVRVQITVDEGGQVVDVKLLTTLGHGLDEAAQHAARSASFEAAVRCGKPTPSTFTLAIRFSAS